MKIIVDAMGGDKAPKEVVKGCIQAAGKVDAEIVLCGIEKIIKKELRRLSYTGSNIIVHNTTEVVTNEDSPTRAIKSKKDSSMVVGLNLLKEGKGDIFLSAGNTGALMAGAFLQLDRIKGVDRPALAPVLPSYSGPVLLVDAGSNTSCKPENLLQFAVMGSIYVKSIIGIENPRVGLVNVGVEAVKGNDLTKQAFALLQESGLNFIGNIEGRDIPLGNVDVAVCDGFTGNVILKVMEGMGKTVSKLFRDEIKKNMLTKLGALLMKPAFDRFKKKLDYTEYGGALYLGIEKPVIKCHGSSNAKAIAKTIEQAEAFVKNQTVEKIRGELLKVEGEINDSGQ